MALLRRKIDDSELNFKHIAYQLFGWTVLRK